MKILLLIFAWPHTVIGQTAECPGPYHAVGSGCYIFPDIETSSWIEANVFCQFSGGYLTNIDSEEEQIALKEYSDANLPGNSYFWIGATDMLSNGTWRWVPSGKTVVYENWGSGEPSLSNESNCVYWTLPYNSWYTLTCCNSNVYIKPLCEVHPL